MAERVQEVRRGRRLLRKTRLSRQFELTRREVDPGHRMGRACAKPKSWRQRGSLLRKPRLRRTIRQESDPAPNTRARREGQGKEALPPALLDLPCHLNHREGGFRNEGTRCLREKARHANRNLRWRAKASRPNRQKRKLKMLRGVSK